MNKQKLIILSTVFIDVLGFGIVIPILPFYLTEYGANAVTITVLFSVYSLFAFLSAPLLGALSDRIGRRPVLLLSIFSTSLGWIVFASAISIPFLFLGRIIDGIAAGNFSTAQNYLIDIANNNEKERVKNLGIIGATFGIGFVLGPMVGGILSKVSHAFPFYFAGSMAFLNGIFAFFFLKESNHNRSIEKLKYNPFNRIINAYNTVSLRPLYIKWFLFSLSVVIVNSIFALFAQHAFFYDSFQTGILFTIIGLIIAINQTLLLNKFWIKHFTYKGLEQTMLSFAIIGLLLAATQNIYLFFFSFLFLGTSQAVYRVVVANSAIQRAEPTMKGEVMGIITSLMIGAMVIIPVTAGALFEENISYPFIIGAIFALSALIFSFKNST